MRCGSFDVKCYALAGVVPTARRRTCEQGHGLAGVRAVVEYGLG